MRKENKEQISPQEIITSDPTLRKVTGVEVEGGFRMGMKISVFNAQMRSRREELDLSQKQLAERVGELLAEKRVEIKPNTLYLTVGEIERFYRFPTDQMAEAIAKILGTAKEILFPAWLRFYLLEKGRGTKVIETPISPKMFEALGKPTYLLLSGPPDILDIEEKVIREELVGILRGAMGTLSERQRRVLELRFGLEDDRERTYKEIGQELGVTKERARQIEMQALYKLRQFDSRHREKLSTFL